MRYQIVALCSVLIFLFGQGLMDVNAQNLLQNPGFETGGLADWATSSVGVFGVNSYPVPVYDGTYQAYVESTNNVTPHYAFIYQQVAASAGQTYTASVWARNYAAPYNQTMQLTMEFYDVNNNYLSEGPVAQAINTTYTQMVTSAVAPAGTAFVRIVPLVYSSASATGIANFDDASLYAMTAGNVILTRAPGRVIKYISIANLLTNVTGVAPGQTIALTGLGSSIQGATITTNGGYIQYLPASGSYSNINDSFTYTVTDGLGGRSTGTIAIYWEPSAVIDTSFPWFSGRSYESIAEEIQAKGFGSVRIMADGGSISQNMVETLHGFGLYVIGSVIGNGVYTTQPNLPADWTNWEMQLEEPQTNSDFIYLSKNNTNYLAWLQNEVVTLATNSGIDAVEVAEAFWPAHYGPVEPQYGSFDSNCTAAFTSQTGESPPNFVNPASPLYWTNVPALYAQWYAARSSWTTEFLNNLCNDGTNGIRIRCPGLKVILWGVASTDASPSTMLQWEGVDGSNIVSTVHPDAYVLETDWTDWENANLQPDYVSGYGAYISAAESGATNIPVLIQTDCGSLSTDRRSSVWLSQCDAAAKGTGAGGVFGYMLSLEQDVYESNLCVLATWDLGQSVRIVLNKWPALAITNLANWQAQGANITSVSRDGCTVVVQLTNRIGSAVVNLAWQPVTDDTSVKFNNGSLPACAWGGPSTVSLLPQSVNLLSNPGFETGTLANWNESTQGTFGVYNYPAPVYDGTYQAFIQSSFNVTPHDAYIYQDVAGSAGQTYTASVWARDYPSYPTTMQLSVQFYDVNTNLLFESPIEQNISTTYTQMVTSAVAPAGTAKIRTVLLLYSSASATGAANFDDASLRVMTAGNVTYTRAPGLGIQYFSIANLLTNVLGAAPGQTFTLTGLGNSSQGASISMNGGNIQYLPTNRTNSDSFTYTVTDGLGGAATGTIFVNVVPATGQNTGTITISGGQTTVTFVGLPGYMYVVQRATNLVPPVAWVNISTNTAPTNGLFQLIDTFSGFGAPPPKAYYQLQTF